MTPGIPRPPVPAALPAVSVRPSRPRRRAERAVGMVEFALIAPLAFLLLLGLLVLAIVVMNLVQLTNAVRDGARAAAVCGGTGFSTGTSNLPNGQSCTSGHLTSYITTKLQSITGVSPNVTVLTGGGTTDLGQCSKGIEVQVTASYQQPLYFPLIGRLIGDAGNSTVRTIQASADATCEQ